MLACRSGIRLVLWVGKTVPQPAPSALLRAISRVEVTNDAKRDDGFQLTFTLTKTPAGEYDLLRGGLLDPDTRVIVGVTLGAVPEPLIDGVIYHHQLQPGVQPGTSTLTVMGRDVRVMLDLEEIDKKFPQQTDSGIVTSILGKSDYAKFGLSPSATATTGVHSESERTPGQHDTDLKFIQALAQRNGFVFYVEPVTFGTNKAYWGPPVRTGQLQPPLTFGSGPAGNLQDLVVKNDALGPVTVKGAMLDPISKQSQNIPPLPDLRVPPLERNSASPRRTKLARETANRDAGEAGTDLLASMMDAPDPVDCTGRLDTVRYGYILRARRLVGVRGVGGSYDGSYYVQSVRHILTMTPGSYIQEFALTRGGTGALASVLTS